MDNKEIIRDAIEGCKGIKPDFGDREQLIKTSLNSILSRYGSMSDAGKYGLCQFFIIFIGLKEDEGSKAGVYELEQEFLKQLPSDMAQLQRDMLRFKWYPTIMLELFNIGKQIHLAARAKLVSTLIADGALGNNRTVVEALKAEVVGYEELSEDAIVGLLARAKSLKGELSGIECKYRSYDSIRDDFDEEMQEIELDAIYARLGVSAGDESGVSHRMSEYLANVFQNIPQHRMKLTPEEITAILTGTKEGRKLMNNERVAKGDKPKSKGKLSRLFSRKGK